MNHVEASLRRAVDASHDWTLYPTEMAILLYELDSIRAQLSHAEQQVEQFRREVTRLRELRPDVAWNGHEAGRACERGSVVAYLRGRHAATQEWEGADNATSRTYDLAADAIERGVHLTEKK